MSDWNTNNNTAATREDGDARFGRFHQSGSTRRTNAGLELLSMPTAAARRLGVEQLKEARKANDRLATCVLGMCAVEGVGGEKNVRAGLGLLEEAADMGSRRAEDYLARYRLSHWEAPQTGDAEAVREHRRETRRLWKYLRGPLMRGVVTEKTHPAAREVFDEILWRGEVTDPVELDCCMVFGTLGHAQATYLAALAYDRGAAGVQSLDVAKSLMWRALRAGYHDAIVWVRRARREGRIA